MTEVDLIKQQLHRLEEAARERFLAADARIDVILRALDRILTMLAEIRSRMPQERTEEAKPMSESP